MQYFTIRSRPTSVIHCNVICSCIYSATPLQTQCTAFFGNTLFFWTHCIASDYIIIQPPALQSKVEPYQWFIALLWLEPWGVYIDLSDPTKTWRWSDDDKNCDDDKWDDDDFKGEVYWPSTGWQWPFQVPLYLRWRVPTLYSSHEIQALSLKYLLKHISHWWRKPITIISNYYLIA